MKSLRSQHRSTVAVLLSGAGLHDGTELHEAAFTALSLSGMGANIVFCAPNIAQPHVVDHHRGDIIPADTRNVLIESARIARGPVLALDSVDVSSLSALVIPGGFGAVKTLCNYGFVGKNARVLSSVSALIDAMIERQRPIVGYCMSTVLLARALGSQSVLLGLGWDPQIDSDCLGWGAKIERCAPDHVTVDRKLRVLSTPAFSATQDLVVVAKSIDTALRGALQWS